jgi:hypothetical protein
MSEPCPKCRLLGKDTRGDNLQTFADGGKFCFACGHTEKSTHFVPPATFQANQTFVTGVIPTNLVEYLSRYLTIQEIHKYFTYDCGTSRLVLKPTLPEFYWGRSDVYSPKVLTRGRVPFHIFGGIYPEGREVSNTCVMVEDPISAIKISRIYDAVPLFGAYFHPEWFGKLKGMGYSNVVFWLDHDKSQEGLKLALAGRHLFHTGWVTTISDPKLYDNQDIRLLVSNTKKREIIHAQA